MIAKLRYVKVGNLIIITGWEGFLKEEKLPIGYISSGGAFMYETETLINSEPKLFVADEETFLIEKGSIFDRAKFSEVVSIMRKCGNNLLKINRVLEKAKKETEKEIEI